jgi:hypothetical protein
MSLSNFPTNVRVYPIMEEVKLHRSLLSVRVNMKCGSVWRKFTRTCDGLSWAEHCEAFLYSLIDSASS